MAIASVSDLDDQIQDYTLEETSTGGSAVQTTHVIAGTVPIRINGAASDDLSTTPTTISALAFTATEPGVVPLSGGSATQFLSADGTWKAIPAFAGTAAGLVPGTSGNDPTLFLTGSGTWVAGTIVGVSSITGTAPIVVTPTTGAAVVSANQGGILVGGIVPATGGADATKFLCATNPLTWTTPGTAGFVTLQPFPPGPTAQSGSAYVDHHLVAGWRMTTGGGLTVTLAAPVAGGGFEAYTGPTLLNSIGLAQQYSGNSDSFFRTGSSRRSRGTVAVPTVTADNDILGAYVGRGYGSALGFNLPYKEQGIYIRADGATAANEQPAYTDIIAGSSANVGSIRTTATGSLFQSAQPSIDVTDRPHSTLDVRGSFAATSVLKTAATPITLGDTDYSYLIDGSSTGDLNITLPTAVGCQGRHYRLQKVDDSDTVMTLLTTGAELVSGVPSGYILLRGRGDYVELVSDGSNWWIEQHHLEGVRSHMTSGSITTVANTVSEGYFLALKCWNVLWPGSIIKIRGNGQFGATGAPTLRLRIRDIGLSVIGDSGPITMPDTGGFSSWVFSFDCELIFNTIAYGGGSGTQWLKCSLRIQQSTAPDTYNTYEWGLIVPPAIVNGDQSFTISAEWGTASALNTISIFSEAVSLEMGCLPL